MRWTILACALAGCVHAASSPPWPQPAATAAADDGGESLAPRPSAHALVEEAAPDATAVLPPALPAVVTRAPEPAAPTASAPAATAPSDDTLTTDGEITIEINDDD